MELPGKSTLYRFYERYKQVVDEDRLRRAVAAKAAIEGTCDEIGDVDAALKNALAFQGLEAVASGDPDQLSKDLVNAIAEIKDVTKGTNHG